MPTQAKLTVTKWSRYTAAEAYQLRLLGAREELSVAMLIRKLSLEGLRRSMLPTTMTARDDEPEQVVGMSA